MNSIESSRSSYVYGQSQVNRPQNSAKNSGASFAAVLAQANQAQGSENPSSNATSGLGSLSPSERDAILSAVLNQELTSILSTTLSDSGGSLDGSTSSDPLSTILGGSSATGSSDPLAALLEGSSSTSGSTDALTALLGGGSSTSSSTADPTQLALEIAGYTSGGLGTEISTDSAPLGSVLPSTDGSMPGITGQVASNGISVIPTYAPTSSESESSGQIGALINEMAPNYGLNPRLVSAVVQQESGFSPTATSSAGAKGLMQLMPGTAAALGVADPYNAVENLRGGMQYLSQLVNRFNGNVPLALAAYNAGPNAVAQYGGIPPYPETERYVANIMQLAGLQNG